MRHLYEFSVFCNKQICFCQTLNKELDEFKVPFEIVEAYIDQIVVILPWRALLAECTSVTVHGLELRLQPKKRSENGGTLVCHFKSFTNLSYNSSLRAPR